MTFLAPDKLWLLAAAAALALAYLVLQRRRRHVAVRYPNLELVAAVAPRSAAWRRHVTAGAALAAVVLLLLALARPAVADEVARDEATVVLAIDVSGSMTATDVAPTRLAAAVAAAKDFVENVPDTFDVGLVTFDDAAHVLATPTTDRAVVTQALDRLTRGPGTAAGDGLFAALDTIAEATGETVSPGEAPFAGVVLLADGASTVGRSLDEAAAAAADQHVPVYTIAFGTDQGTVEVDGETVPVPADPAAMSAVADTTGGEMFEATSGD